MFSENIELVDRENKPVYKRQLSKLGEKGEGALNASPSPDFFEEEDEHPELDPADAKIVSDLISINVVCVENVTRGP